MESEDILQPDQDPLAPPLPVSNAPPAQQTPNDHLHQAQALWAAMFRTSGNMKASDGHRPIILSIENQRTNDEWGDTLVEKLDTVTRVYGMNVNGLQLDQRGGQLDVLCKMITEVQADVFCGQEHNLDSDNTQVRQILYHTARQHWNRSRLTFGTTPIPFPKQYKPGGTFIMTAGDLTGRVISQKQDKWGRWVSHVYQGRGRTKVEIYSAYQVVNKTIKQGCITTALQQQSLLTQSQDCLKNPRSAFRRDITLALQASIVSGHEILMLGDFNEAFGTDVDGMIKIANTCGLQDLMSIRNSSKPPATYARGRLRLDYALATDHVARSLSKAGYEPFNSRFPSDHRAYFLDFDTKLLFGTDTQQLGQPSNRIFRSNNVAQNTQYIKAKYDLLTTHNAFDRGDRLSLPGDRHQYAERLDRDVVAASIAAEKQMKKYGAPSWSVALDKARKLVTMLVHGSDRIGHHQVYIPPTQAEWDEPFIPSTTIHECSTQLREAKQKVNEIVKSSFSHREKELRERIQVMTSSPFKSDKEHSQKLRRLQKAEDLKQIFRKLKAFRTDQRQGVTRVEIPLHPGTDAKSCTEWRQIDVPSQQRFCFTYNRGIEIISGKLADPHLQ
jgi:exonuclease III